MNINIKIANQIKCLDYISVMIEHFEFKKKEVIENLQNNISLYMQKHSENEEAISDLLRFLYWYTEISTSDIARYTDLSTQKVVARVGSLVESRSCKRCSSQFPYERSSRSDIGLGLCPACISSETVERDKIFLSKWIKDENPRIKDYKLYLQSNHWKKMRKEALQRANYKCNACSSRDQVLEVHHNTYENIGQELQEDLIVLCKSCHAKIHQK